MRRALSVALIGLAVAAAASDASAQARPGRARGGVADTARMRRMDSLRVARGDTGLRRAPDSVRQQRLDSARAGMPGRGRGMGPAGRGMGPAGRGAPGMALGGGRGALMGIALNDNEKAAIKTINEKYRAELEQLRGANQQGAAARNPQLRTQMQDIMERQQAEIRGALTAEHQKQFDENLAKRPGRGGKASHQGRKPAQAHAPRGR